jgi:rsbT co-antagonist protein RsbR
MVVSKHETALLRDWVAQQRSASTLREDLMEPEEREEQSRRFLSLFRSGLESGGGDSDINAPAWQETRELLAELSRSRARQGFSAAETAKFVFSLKAALFDLVRREADDPAQQSALVLTLSRLLDGLGLYTTDVFLKGREDIIKRQQQDMLELSTPVVQLWQGILALPVIGTLDSARTQTVMENLLEKIVETSAAIAIIDITGVPTVDTLTAQHLLKTVAAARLMGAECIISGIRPQIAQTIVHLGVDLEDVITKSSLADAFAIALQRNGMRIVPRADA